MKNKIKENPNNIEYVPIEEMTSELLYLYIKYSLRYQKYKALDKAMINKLNQFPVDLYDTKVIELILDELNVICWVRLPKKVIARYKDLFIKADIETIRYLDRCETTEEERLRYVKHDPSKIPETFLENCSVSEQSVYFDLIFNKIESTKSEYEKESCAKLCKSLNKLTDEQTLSLIKCKFEFVHNLNKCGEKTADYILKEMTNIRTGRGRVHMSGSMIEQISSIIPYSHYTQFIKQGYISWSLDKNVPKEHSFAFAYLNIRKYMSYSDEEYGDDILTEDVINHYCKRYNIYYSLKINVWEVPYEKIGECCEKYDMSFLTNKNPYYVHPDKKKVLVKLGYMKS